MATVEESMSTDQRPSLVALLLDEQQELTAVEQFSQRNEAADSPLFADYYRDLIPLSQPGPGEQYAFEVDLDACSGCKACVAACHNLNGLDEGEQWRSVGMLHGTAEQASVLQHVTTACHHCLDPACLTGCPVMAYDKDPLTGIVRHLDDQCIGCQYCVFMCPYDVPQYRPSRGIVRKCDMCHDRLTVGEAPACVQSCPNGAIRIRTVVQETFGKEEGNKCLLPTAPDSAITRPTTVYQSKQPLAAELLPADFFSANKQHGHLPLVWMLVLTQLSVGAFVLGQALLLGPWREPLMLETVRPAFAIASPLVGVVGLHAAVLHLGRPLYAFRAFLGLRTSWLSREIVVFGGFTLLAFAYAALLWLAKDDPQWLPMANGLGWATAVTGMVGVFCSVMIYVVTRRPFWSGYRTGGKFFLTCAVLGLPGALLMSFAACYASEQLTVHGVMRQYGQSLCRWLIVAVLSKLALESTILLWLWQREMTPLKRTALLMTGDLGINMLLRGFFAVMGGILLPLMLLADRATSTGAEGFQPLFMGFVVVLITGLLLIGELLERHTFFAASVASRMPGATSP